MSDFLRYMEAQANKRTAMAEYNAASARLLLAQIRERLAEIRSQHEPLSAINESTRSPREQMVAAATYVVTGNYALAKPKEEQS